MPIKNNNTASGLPANNTFQVGRSNVDNNEVIEQGVTLPVPTDSKASYVYYECFVGTMLDSGIVVHNRLPQTNNGYDTLSTTTLDAANLDQITVSGVNLKCMDQYADIVQRMGHARYWFRIWGQALRVGYQVPIPGIKTIGGVAAIPYDRNPQWAYNAIAPGGNYGGLVLWRAAWSLWYATAIPPTSNTFPAADPSAHINGAAGVPDGVQAPYSVADDAAVPSAPVGRAIPVNTIVQ